MPPVAAIDIGTNSVKLTVAAIVEDHLAILTEKSRTTRLGEGVDQSKRLADAAIERTFLAVRRLADDARSFGVTRIAATGTSALREASNGDVLIDRIRQELKIVVEIIGGEREAQLAYRAVAADPSLGFEVDVPLLVFDIGGGSTELICGHGANVAAHRSLDIGAVRLTERHLRADPPTSEEYASARADADNQIHSFQDCPDGKRAICGVGGTAVNIAAVVHGRRDVHGMFVTREQLSSTAQLFLSTPLAERKKIPDLEPDRADIILGGTAILEEIMDRYQADSLRVSVRGMRYGLLLEML